MRLKHAILTGLVLVGVYLCGMYQTESWQKTTSFLKRIRIEAEELPTTAVAKVSTPCPTHTCPAFPTSSACPACLTSTACPACPSTPPATSPEVLVTMKAATDHNRLTGTVAGYKEALDSLKWIHQETEKRLASITTVKKILYWYKPWGSDVNTRRLPRDCGGCEITGDVAQINSDSVGAVIFHVVELKKETMPKKRNPDHYYVYQTMESSAFIKKGIHRDLREYDGVFNLTMSYRRDSDVYSAYSTAATVLKEIQRKYRQSNDAGIAEVIAGKKQLALWIVSNCDITDGARRRKALVDKMVEIGIDIDRRGRCYPENADPPGLRSERGNGEQSKLMAESKFYVSFENSHHCRDYFTEKLFENAFAAGTVPIVWGAPKEDYEAVVPPKSCIFVDDYENLEDLRDHINYLNGNDTAYREYLQWRTMDLRDVFGYGLKDRACHLCRILNGINVDNRISTESRLDDVPLFGHKRRVVDSLSAWQFDKEREECFK